jgi:phosphatidylglycerol lysyltransferase
MLMAGYDLLALRYIGRPLAVGKTAMASFLGNAFSNNIGFSMIAGASVRYRLYSTWGLSAVEITQVVLFCTSTLWLGFLGLSGAVFLVEPLALPQCLHLPFATARPLGLLLLLGVGSYLLCTLVLKEKIAIRGWSLSLPSLGLAGSQLSIGVLDWWLSGSVLYCLLPQSTPIGFTAFLEIYLLAQLGALISQVPGGLGVFETLILTLAPSNIPPPQLLGALIVFRGIYYLLPLLVAMVVLGIEELLPHGAFMARIKSLAGGALERVLVPMLCLGVFVAGAILLFSGALPAVSHRLVRLDAFEPLPILEISHFIGSLAGMALLLLARGLQWRLDAAYLLTLGILICGIAASLLKGLDYEEALLLSLVLMVLLPNRRLFYRRTSLLSERFTTGWLAAIAMVLFASIWLGLFAYRHVEYQNDLWWHFSLKGEAPRFMRATVGCLVLALVFALARLLRPAPPRPDLAASQQMPTITEIVRQSPSTTANLALLGDKRFVLSADTNAFIMYAVSGETWVSMGDPVGPAEQWPELIWQFQHQARRYADRAVFYEIGHEHLHLYLDVGLSLLKLGEEARVPLDDFSLEGSGRKELRHIRRKLARRGCTFEILPAAEVPGVVSSLKTVSDAWLAQKNTHEKGFSLGFFDPQYLQKTAAAVVRIDQRIVAFGNVWQSGGHQEVTLDLMRQLPDAPNGTMEYLFIELMLWGKAQGFHWFNLGMAPLRGMQTRDSAPMWHKVSSWVARHGEHLYNFEGLRRYKEKFDPVWRPKFLACPGGLALPRILADIGSLVSGGYKGILFK